MRRVFWLLAICIAAVAVAIAASYNSGYVLLVVQPYRIELSLNLLLVLLLAVFVLGYFVVRLISITLRLPTEIRESRMNRRREKAHSAMLDGIKSFLEGRYVKAEKSATAALEIKESSSVTAINTIIAARSAHELREYSKRDEFIVMAENEAPEEVTLRLITHAELLLDERRPLEGLQVLQRLHPGEVRQHTAALRLSLKAHQQLSNWDAVLDLVGELEQRNAFDRTLVEQIRLNAHLQNLKVKSTDLQQLKNYWQSIPSSERKQGKLAAAAARAYISLGECVTAHQIIEQSLDHEWNQELTGLYADCLGEDAMHQIKRAESWLESHANDAGLLLALGRMCLHFELWGKSQNYLEASLSLDPSHSAHFALAHLNEKIGKPELAKEHYTKGLELILGHLELSRVRQ